MQVGPDLYSYIATKNLWLKYCNAGSDRLDQCTLELKESPLLIRVCQAAINMADRSIYMTSGDVAGNTSKSCDLYDIERDKWVIAPELQLARTYHSGCALGDNAFVFCGTGMRVKLNSIEVLDTRADSQIWRLIDIPEDLLSARVNPVVVAASTNEILIMGGYNNVYYGDINVFNTETEIVKHEKTLASKFCAISN